MFTTKKAAAHRAELDGLNRTLTLERADRDREMAALIAERDELLELVGLHKAEAARYKETARARSLEVARNTIGLEEDVATIGSAIESRVSMTALLGLCHEIMDRRTATSTKVIPALLSGYTAAQEARKQPEEAPNV